MKKIKHTPNKKAPVRKVVKPVLDKKAPVCTEDVKVSCCSNVVWSWTIYVYWFIILFFIAATFYIIGRSQEFLHPSNPNVILAEEVLDLSDDLFKSAKDKVAAGDLDGAIVDLNGAIENNANTNAYVLRGEVFLQMGDYEKALNDFNAALESDGMNAVAFYDRYLLNARLENYEAALNDINNALAAQSMKPTDILTMRDLYAKRGQLNLWMKNWQGAIADYTNSLARAEGSVVPNVYSERAEAYTAIGDYDSAVNDYTSAVRVISEQIQAAPTQDIREAQSSNAMSYFEKSAALNVKMGKMDIAKTDLESAYAIAVALNDTESINRIQNLINGLNNN